MRSGLVIPTLAACIALGACGDDDCHTGVINYCGPSDVAPGAEPRVIGDAAMASEIVAAQRYVEACLGETFDLADLVFYVERTKEEVRDACRVPRGSGTIACSYGPEVYVTRDYDDAEHRAEIIAHELGHRYIWLATHDNDATHVSNWWFGRDGGAVDYGGLGLDGSVADCARHRAMHPRRRS